MSSRAILAPPRILRFREEADQLDVIVQRTRSLLVVRGRIQTDDLESLPTEIVLRSKDRDRLASVAPADDGSFTLQTIWSRRRTLFLEAGPFFVPVIRALEHPGRRRLDRIRVAWASRQLTPRF